MKSYRIPFRTTQLLMFGLVILGAGVLNTLTLYRLHHYLGIFDQSLVGYHAIQQFTQEMEDSRIMLGTYVRQREVEHADSFLRSGERLESLLTTIRSYNSTGVAASYELRALANGLEAYIETGRAVLDRIVDDDPDAFSHYLRAQRVSDFMFRYTQRLMHIRLREELVTHAEIRADAHLVGIGAFGGIAVMAALLLLFLFLLNKLITTPVRHLAHAAQRIAMGNLETQEVNVSSVEEIHLLADVFNRMNRNIRSLVQDLKDKSALELQNAQMERRMEEARFQQLQAQINPHFLFNNLNAIARAALFEHAPQSARLIQALSQLLRHTLNASSTVSPIEHELLVVQEYMHIQEYRFGHRLRFEIDSSGDLASVYIPCLTVQPLVENAVQHGIEPHEEGGSVRLKLHRHDGRITIVVS
ncbi:MAG: histidine kinase, partial [Spirochaetota bacterium]